MPAGTDPVGLAAFVTRWAPLLDGASEPIVVVRAENFRPMYANDAALLAFGERLKSRVDEALDRRVRDRLVHAGLWGGVDLLGWTMHALAISDPPADSEGYLLHWTPDVTLRRPHADTLRRLVDLSSDALIGVEASGRIVYRNSRARGMFHKEILGLRAPDALPQGALLALGGGSPEPEPAEDASGRERALQWVGLALGGDALPAVAIGRDVTEVHLATARLANRVKRLEAMHTISRALARGEPPGSLAAMAASRLGEVVPLRALSLYQLSGDRGEADELRLVGLYTWEGGRGRELSETLPLDEHPAVSAVRRQATELISTTGPEAARWPLLTTLAQQGVRGVAAVPLIDEARVLGVIWLASGRSAGFNADDIGAAQELGDLLVNAIVRARLQDRIAGYTRELEARVEARTSELRTTQQQLVVAARLSSIGELSAGVAHELNQPLNVISGYLELLQEGDMSPDEATHAVDVMSKAADRMASLVRHLRDFSRAGVETLRGVDLRQVIDMARELTARATRTPVSVLWERPPDPVTVLGDPGRLEQLFINLIANAMQATEAAGRAHVSVRIARGPDELAVEVIDQGRGVPQHLRSRIFEPFFTTKERGQGTGLGLSISAKIASEHQGRLQVDDAPGGGAIFRVILPGYRVG